MIERMMIMSFGEYSADSEECYQNVVMRWKCYVGYMQDFNPEMKIVGEPKVCAAEYRNGAFLYTCYVTVSMPEVFEPVYVQQV